MDSHKLINIIVMATVFLLILSVWCICIFLWVVQYLKRLQNVQQRLGMGEKSRVNESKILKLWSESQRETSSDARQEVPNEIRQPALLKRMEFMRDNAGWHASVLMIITRLLMTVVLTFIITYLISGVVLLAIGVSAAVILIFWSYLQKCTSKYSILFERQLSDALGIAARALRAGHPLVGTFQLIAEEIGAPLGDVFARICQEQTLGLDIKDSIHKVAKTTSSSELKLFATAIAIQIQSGGNLVDLMDRLTTVIRTRMRMNRRVRVITAQTQFSKKVLIALPILLFFLLNILNPQYMEPFYNTNAGRYMLAIGVAGILLGSWMMNRLSIIRF
jgi:tight adherence protein B